MIRPRIIPVLLLKNEGLYKTSQFKNPVYVGDPINSMRIFNDKEVDEIIVLDIGATRNGSEPNFTYIEDLVSESFMPLAYGGGIKTLEQAKRLFSIGVEKIVLNSAALENPDLIRAIADSGGSQSVVVSIDVRRHFLYKERVYTHGASKRSDFTPVDYARRAVENGAGEIIVTSVAHEGRMQGFDLALIRAVSEAVDVPVIAHGGAGTLAHIKQALSVGRASAVAAGSMFVFQGPHRAVLISYPSASIITGLAS